MDARLRLELLRQFAIRRNMVEMQAARDAMRIPDETIVGVDSSQQKLITIDPEGNVRLQKTLSNATAGTGVKSLPKGGQTGTFKPTRVPELEPVPAEEIDIEKLQIVLFFGDGTNSFFGGDRPSPTTSPPFPPEASGTDFRIDKNSPNDTLVDLTTDGIADAHVGDAATVVPRLFFASPENTLSDNPLKRPRSAVGQRFATESLWYVANGSAAPTIPTELHAVFQGTNLTTSVTSSVATVGFLREIRLQADTWITPTYKKAAFLGSNWRLGVSVNTCFFYLDYRPILLSRDGQNCLFRREQFIAGANSGSFPPYVTALQGYSNWVSTGNNQFWVDYWLLWEGVEYRITNPSVLGVTYTNFINYGTSFGSLESTYSDDFNAVFGARFRSFVGDEIYFVNLPTILTVFGLIVSAPALSATNQIPVRQYTFTLDSGAGTATFTDNGPTNYKMLFYPEYATFATGIGAASFAP